MGWSKLSITKVRLLSHKLEPTSCKLQAIELWVANQWVASCKPTSCYLGSSEMWVAKQWVASCEPTRYKFLVNELLVASQQVANCKSMRSELRAKELQSGSQRVVSCNPTSCNCIRLWANEWGVYHTAPFEMQDKRPASCKPTNLWAATLQVKNWRGVVNLKIFYKSILVVF